MENELCPICGFDKPEIMCSLCGDIVCPECTREGIQYELICADCIKLDKEINNG